jgi:hypothetical protein
MEADQGSDVVEGLASHAKLENRRRTAHGSGDHGRVSAVLADLVDRARTTQPQRRARISTSYIVQNQ